MTFIEQINLEITNISLEFERESLWTKHLSKLSIDKNKKEELTNVEIGFYSLFFKKYQELIVPLICDKIIPDFEEWYEEEVDFEDIKLQAFALKNLDDGEWEVFFEDDQEDLLVGLVMKNWEVQYVTRIG